MTQTGSMSTVDVSLTVNGNDVNASVDPRLLLSDFLRHELQLTGTHVGCEHGVCGCCTVHIDGQAARSCLAFVAQLDGAEVHTVESLAGTDGQLNVLQEAFRECHALQCGFCTPGFLMSISDLLADQRTDLSDLKDDSVRRAIAGNLCRCTGYQNIVAAVRLAAERIVQ